MKFNIWKASLVLLCAMTTALSCVKSEEQKTEDPTPVFPTDVINKTVAAGESVDISINPNLAWEASISGEGSGNFFWLDDDGMKATKVTGAKAGAAVITVVFSDDEEFDVNRVCEVTLKMGGQSKKIAVITRPSLGRTFVMYAGLSNEENYTGEFSAEPTTEVTFNTFKGTEIYGVPLRVVSNYDWNISLPSWVVAVNLDTEEEITGGKAGTTEFGLAAKLSKDLADGKDDVIKFIDAINTDAAQELKVKLPAFGDRIEIQEINSLEFNKAGQVVMPNGDYADLPAFAYVIAVEGFVLRAVEWNGTALENEFADWVTYEHSEFDEEGGIMQSVDIKISVTENPGRTREADLYVLPYTMADLSAEQLSNAYGTDEYSQYYLGRLKQIGEIPPYLTPISSEEAMAEVGTYFSMLDPKGDDNVMQWDFKAPVYQKITYTGEWSADEASFECSEPFSYVRLFKDTDYPVGFFSEEVAEGEEHWIKFTAFGGENLKGRFNMNFLPESPTHTAAVFYNGNNEIIAAVLVEYDPDSTGDDDAVPYKVASGVATISKMDTQSDLYMALSDSFNVTEVYELSTNDKMVYVEGTEEYWDVFIVDPATLNDLKNSPLEIEGASPNFYLYTGNGSERAEAVFVFKTKGADGSSLINFAAIHVIYDPEASIDVEAPFTFVYPEYVNGVATLGLYEGDMLETIMSEQWGIEAKDVYELKYTDASASSVAVINVPAVPHTEAAWNNYPFSDSYWLQYEMNGSQMTVFMSEAGKTDYFVFNDSTGLPSCILVCTMEIEQ